MQQLHPKAFWMFFLRSVLGWFFAFLLFGIYIIAGLFAAISTTGDLAAAIGVTSTILLFSAVFVLVFSLVWAKLSYKYYKYELTKDEFRKEYGVIWKRYVSIPLSRVQNVDIMRGIVARLLGLSDIQIHTAGVGGQPRGEGRLPGLSREEAETFREELLKKVKKTGGSGL